MLTELQDRDRSRIGCCPSHGWRGRGKLSHSPALTDTITQSAAAPEPTGSLCQKASFRPIRAEVRHGGSLVTRRPSACGRGQGGPEQASMLALLGRLLTELQSFYCSVAPFSVELKCNITLHYVLCHHLAGCARKPCSESLERAQPEATT